MKIEHTGWVKKVSCCTVKVESVVKYSMLHTFVTSICLRKLVFVCLAVISVTTFSHRIFKLKTVVTCVKISDCASFSL